MNGAKGFLTVSMEPPAIMEEEFNDWYDTEHVPERAAIAGFETARRFVCVAGWPRYLAFYDLRTAAVLDEPGYRAVSGDRFSPWTKRVLQRVRGQYRATGDQIYPGQALTGDFARMLLLRFHHAPAAAAAAIVSSTRSAFEARPGIKQVRVFKHADGDQSDFLALIEATAPFPPEAVDARAFGDAARWLDLINEYAPYWTRGRLPGVYTEAPA